MSVFPPHRTVFMHATQCSPYLDQSPREPLWWQHNRGSNPPLSVESSARNHEVALSGVWGDSNPRGRERQGDSPFGLSSSERSKPSRRRGEDGSLRSKMRESPSPL